MGTVNLTRKSPYKARVVFSAKFVVMIGLFYLILREIEFDKFAHVLKGIQPSYLAGPFLIYAVALHLRAVKLAWLLAGYKILIRLRTAFVLNWIGTFFNNFLPSSVGGDLYRVLDLNRRYPYSPAQVVSSVIIDRGLGFLTTIVFAGMTSVFFIGIFALTPWVLALFYAGVILAILTGFFILFAGHNLRLSNTSRYAVVNKVINGVNVLVTYPEKTLLIRSLIVSAMIFGLTIVSNYFLFLAFDVEVSFWILLFVISIVSVAGMIPVSINSLGITEGVGIVLFGYFGYAPEVILSIFLTGRILLILCSATGGIPFMLRHEAI